MTDKPKPKEWAAPQPTVEEALEFVDGGWAGSQYPVSYGRAARVLAAEVRRLRAPDQPRRC
jgi:hypothetical protein